MKFRFLPLIIVTGVKKLTVGYRVDIPGMRITFPNGTLADIEQHLFQENKPEYIDDRICVSMKKKEDTPDRLLLSNADCTQFANQILCRRY